MQAFSSSAWALRSPSDLLYAAADALELAPKAVRPAVIAAFAQAQRLGLTVDALLPQLTRKK